MESKSFDDDPRRTARSALADAHAARDGVVRGVHYPPAYRPLMAFSGGGLPLLMAAGSGGVPSGFLTGLLLMIGLVAVFASGWALHVFEAGNGVRITGLRSGKRISVAYLVAMLSLLVMVAAVSRAAGVWWVALIASPVGAAITLVYVNAWLADYRRDQG